MYTNFNKLKTYKLPRDFEHYRDFVDIFTTTIVGLHQHVQAASDPMI